MRTIGLTVLILAAAATTNIRGESTLPFENYNSVIADMFTMQNKLSLNYRLPNHTHPETYDISIKTRVDLAEFDFSGRVKIGIAVDEATQQIVLHTRLLNVTEVQLFRRNGNSNAEVIIARHTYDEELEFLTIHTDNVVLNAGDSLQLNIAYNGSLRNVPYGFYRSSYKNADGSKT